MAMDVEALLHMPPAVEQLKVVTAAGHADNVPVMDAGTGCIVSVRVAAQPVVLV